MSDTSDSTVCFDMTRMRDVLLSSVSSSLEGLHTDLTAIQEILNGQLTLEQLNNSLAPIMASLNEQLTLEQLNSALAPLLEGMRGQLTLEQLRGELALIHEILRGQLTVGQLREELAALQHSVSEQTGRKTVTFTKSGTFTPPANIQWVNIILCGAGAGGSAALSNRYMPAEPIFYPAAHGEASSFGQLSADGGKAGATVFNPSGSLVGTPGQGGGQSQAYSSSAAAGTIVRASGAATAPLGALQRLAGQDGDMAMRQTYSAGTPKSVNGGGSYEKGGVFNSQGSYAPPPANSGGGGGVDAAALSTANKILYMQGGGGGEIVYGIVPVSGPVPIVIGHGGAGGSSFGLPGAEGICIVMY